jgi:hypothetical protein
VPGVDDCDVGVPVVPTDVTELGCPNVLCPCVPNAAAGVHRVLALSSVCMSP